MARNRRKELNADENKKMQLLKIEEHRSLAEIAEERIRAEILAGRLEPGEKIPQEQVAAQLGISRVPVREALHRLEAEGVVTLRPHVGFVVTKLTLEELEEIYATREIVEGGATSLSARQISDEELARLESIVKELRKAAKAGDLGRWLALDREFHLVTYAPCKLPRLLKIISEFWNATQGYRRAYATIPGSIEAANSAHLQILEALRRRDPAEAERLVRTHIRQTVEGIVSNRDRMGL